MKGTSRQNRHTRKSSERETKESGKTNNYLPEIKGIYFHYGHHYSDGFLLDCETKEIQFKRNRYKFNTEKKSQKDISYMYDLEWTFIIDSETVQSVVKAIDVNEVLSWPEYEYNDSIGSIQWAIFIERTDGTTIEKKAGGDFHHWEKLRDELMAIGDKRTSSISVNSSEIQAIRFKDTGAYGEMSFNCAKPEYDTVLGDYVLLSQRDWDSVIVVIQRHGLDKVVTEAERIVADTYVDGRLEIHLRESYLCIDVSKYTDRWLNFVRDMKGVISRLSKRY